MKQQNDTSLYHAREGLVLENFQGPIEYLLQLILKSELNIYDISLCQITSQYLQKLQKLLTPDIDSGAAFIGTTASLLLLKSKRMLPKQESEELVIEEELDPQFEIIHHLIDYCRFKTAARELKEREEQQTSYFSRGLEGHVFETKKGLGIQHLTLQDLAELFQHILAKAPRHSSIHEEQFRVSDKIQFIVNELKTTNSILFNVLFAPSLCRNELIALFLAVLELMKQGKIALIKEESTSSVMIIPKETVNS